MVGFLQLSGLSRQCPADPPQQSVVRLRPCRIYLLPGTYLKAPPSGSARSLTAPGQDPWGETVLSFFVDVPTRADCPQVTWLPNCCCDSDQVCWAHGVR